MSQQTSDILHGITITHSYLLLKFKVTLQTSSIGKDNFLLVEADAATPDEYGFKTINLAQHYNSLSRELYIYFETTPPTGDYDLQISGLKSANGSVLQNESIQIRYEAEALEPKDPEHTPVEIIEIHDRSIRREAFIVAERIRASNPYFYIVDTDPPNDSVFIEEDHKRGRVSVTFSDRPSPQYLNSEYIKVQRKNVHKIGRWETLPVQISMDSHFPVVNIYVPAFKSLDEEEESATPISELDLVYNTNGYGYFEDDYKYRVRLSKEIGV